MSLWLVILYINKADWPGMKEFLKTRLDRTKEYSLIELTYDMFLSNPRCTMYVLKSSIYCGTVKFCYKQFVVYHTNTLYGFSTLLYEIVT